MDVNLRDEAESQERTDKGEDSNTNIRLRIQKDMYMSVTWQGWLLDKSYIEYAVKTYRQVIIQLVSCENADG